MKKVLEVLNKIFRFLPPTILYAVIVSLIAGIVLSLCISSADSVLYCLILLFSFIGAMVSFLTYAIIAAKRNINHEKCGKKSFYYLSGLCEGFETIVALFLMCIFFDYIKTISIVFSIMCLITTATRSYYAFRDFY
jgi:hypothetical protein